MLYVLINLSRARPKNRAVGMELTSLSNNTSHPRTVVVHFQNTPFKFAAMMRPVRFPIATCSAPFRPPVLAAHKDILAIKRLEPWTLGIVIRSGFARLRLDIVVPLNTTSSPFSLFIGLLCRVGPQRNNPRIVEYHEKHS